MPALSIIIFFAITFCLGYSVTKWVKESDNFLERNLMRIGIGLGVFIALGLLLNLIRVPLDWKTFLSLGIVIPLIYSFIIIKNFGSLNNLKKSFRLKITKYDIIIFIVIIIFTLTLYMYVKGAFSYPWLEDDDSWSHAVGVKYVATEKTVFTKQPVRYIDPYPPSYDMLLGILHQTNDSVYWTLKFFNALIISLSIIFFFFFVKEISDSNRALFSTFALASVPAFLSHFIWAISLSLPLYFISFYAIERIKYDKKWIFVASMVIGVTLITSPTHSTYFGLFLAIYFVIMAVLDKSILIKYTSAGLLGLIISFLLWWLPSIIRHGLTGTLNGIGIGTKSSFVSVAGTGDRVYSIKDFFIAEKGNMINSPIGIGLVLSLLLIIAFVSLIYRYRNELNKYKLKIFVAFSIIMVVLLFLLSQTYTKYVPKRNVMALEKGSIPFFEFLNDKIFLILGLSIMIFVLILLLIANYNKKKLKEDFKEGYIIIALSWLIFSFYAVNAAPFYYKLSPFRVWSILAIPLAILISEGILFLISLLKIFKIPKSLIVFVVVVSILLTSAYQKYTVNTTIWSPGGFWTSNEEIQGYMWFKDNIPSGTKVFTFSNSGVIIGLDKFVCHWCEDIKKYQKNGFNETPQDFKLWLNKRGYTHFVIDGQTAQRFGINETSNKLGAIATSGLFNIVHQTNGFFMFRVA